MTTRHGFFVPACAALSAFCLSAGASEIYNTFVDSTSLDSGSLADPSNNYLNRAGEEYGDINVGPIYIGNTTSYNNLYVSNQACISGNVINIGFAAGSDHNSFSAIGPKYSDYHDVYAGNLNVGVAGSFNSFSASAGKSLNFVLSVGTSGGSHNSATITGTGTYLFSSSYISAGDDGVSNSITFSDGAVADSIHGLIGGTSDSDNNSILVTGAGTRWNCADLLSVGYGGIGDAPEGNTLTIADGAMVVVGRAGEGTVDGDKVRVGEGNYLRLDQTSTLALLGDIDDTGTYSQESLLPFFMVDMGAGWEAADASDLIFSYHAEEYLGLTGYTFITVVPEPSSYAIFGGLAAAGLALARRRRSVAS